MFKFGDLVVTTNESQLRHIEDVGLISGINSFGYLLINDSRVGFNPESFRHAMPEEIAAGHRIDKCEVLDMVDVSPNCEVRNG